MYVMETKTCNTCHLDLDLKCFQKTKHGNRNKCNQCRSNEANLRYKDNECGRRDKIKEHVRKTRLRNVKFMLEYLALHPCVDCGESDPVVLEFDHVRGIKRFNLATRIHSAARWETIASEIEKCDVRCANCHRKKTALASGGWYKEALESIHSPVV